MTSTGNPLQQTIALFSAGRLAEADALCQTLLAADPANFNLLHLAGAIKTSRGQHLPALAYFDAALQQNPAAAEVYRHRAQALNALERLTDALDSLERALAVQADHFGVLCEKAMLLRRLDRLDEALLTLTTALALQPANPALLNDSGLLLHTLGRNVEALTRFDRLIATAPNEAAAHFNKGNALAALGRHREALACHERAIALKPDFFKALNNRGNALLALRQSAQALQSFDRALAVSPEHPEALNNRGAALRDLNRAAEALANFERALARDPAHVEAHNNAGNALSDLNRFAEAVDCFQRAISLKPDYAIAHHNLGNALGELGRLDEAIAAYRRALELDPRYVDACSNLLFLHAYNLSTDAAHYLDLARGWERACLDDTARSAARNKTFHRTPLTGRRLRLGYVSGDFCQHAVSYFIEQLLRCHDRSAVEIYAYPTHGREDAVSKRLQALVEHWVPASGLDDEAFVAQIDADAIDVLIDLSGHTAHNRLGVFARRAAPVQAHYLGYFASTGLTEMDYWIGDEVLTPPALENQFSETLWRLRAPWVCYEGKVEVPVPALERGHDDKIILGSFNNLGKLTPATLALWARVLQALPQAQLLLKTRQLADDKNRHRILDAMQAHGITANRIELNDGSSTPGWAAHMAFYNRLDIALDPVGAVGGGTTTCDALWMAVPVVTLAGDRMASRMTASMLHALGHPEWCAENEDAYIEAVVALAADFERRRALRAGLRDQMAASPLCDARGLAVQLELAYAAMFNARTNPGHGQGHTTT